MYLTSMGLHRFGGKHILNTASTLDEIKKKDSGAPWPHLVELHIVDGLFFFHQIRANNYRSVLVLKNRFKTRSNRGDNHYISVSWVNVSLFV